MAESNKKEEELVEVVVVGRWDRIVVFADRVCVGSVVFVFNVSLDGVVKPDGVDDSSIWRGLDGVEDVLEEILFPNGCFGGNG